MNTEPYNSRELLVKQRLEKEGYTVYRDGWPDMVATNDSEIRLIEVKSGKDAVRKSQETMHELLKRAGLKVEVVRVPVIPDGIKGERSGSNGIRIVIDVDNVDAIRTIIDGIKTEGILPISGISISKMANLLIRHGIRDFLRKQSDVDCKTG